MRLIINLSQNIGPVALNDQFLNFDVFAPVGYYDLQSHSYNKATFFAQSTENGPATAMSLSGLSKINGGVVPSQMPTGGRITFSLAADGVTLTNPNPVGFVSMSFAGAFPIMDPYFDDYYGYPSAAAISASYQNYSQALQNWFIAANTDEQTVFDLTLGDMTATITTDLALSVNALFDLPSAPDIEFVGSDFNDSITGGSGRDIFRSGKGDDIFSGGDGTDTFEGIPASLAIFWSDENQLSGGQGIDTIKWPGDFVVYTKRVNTTVKDFIEGTGTPTLVVSIFDRSDELIDRFEVLQFAGTVVSYDEIKAIAAFRWAVDSAISLAEKLVTFLDLAVDLPEPYKDHFDTLAYLIELAARGYEIKNSPDPYKALFVESTVVLVDALQEYTDTVAPVTAPFSDALYDNMRDVVRIKAASLYDYIMASTLPVSENLGEKWGDLWHGVKEEVDRPDVETLPSPPFIPEVGPVPDLQQPVIINGGEFGDYFEGSSGPEAFKGENGGDIFKPRGGNDSIDGGSGKDEVIYEGPRAGTVGSTTSDGAVVFSGQSIGTDTLREVERVTFDDGSLVFDLVGSDPSLIYRLYQAAFARTPDEGGLRYWAGAADAFGLTQLQLAREFRVAPEFIQLYGSNVSNRDYTYNMYKNVLGREPDQGGIDYWTNVVDIGWVNRDQLLIEFAQSPENMTLTSPNTSVGYWVV